MTEDEILEAWDDLCREHDRLKEEDGRLFRRVVSGQRAVAAGSGTGPSDADLDAWEATGAELERHRKRMHDFCKKYARGHVG